MYILYSYRHLTRSSRGQEERVRYWLTEAAVPRSTNIRYLLKRNVCDIRSVHHSTSSIPKPIVKLDDVCHIETQVSREKKR